MTGMEQKIGELVPKINISGEKNRSKILLQKHEVNMGSFEALDGLFSPLGEKRNSDLVITAQS